MAIEKAEAFSAGFNKGRFVDTSPLDKGKYEHLLAYPDWLVGEKELFEVAEQHTTKIKSKNDEMGGGDLFSEKSHDIIYSKKGYDDFRKSFSDRRDWLAGFWTAIAVKNFYKAE